MSADRIEDLGPGQTQNGVRVPNGEQGPDAAALGAFTSDLDRDFNHRFQREMTVAPK